jgi:ribosomal protein L15E
MLHHEFFYQHIKHLQAEQRERVRLERLAYEDRPRRPGVSAKGRLTVARLLIALGRRLEGKRQSAPA